MFIPWKRFQLTLRSKTDYRADLTAEKIRDVYYTKILIYQYKSFDFCTLDIITKSVSNLTSKVCQDEILILKISQKIRYISLFGIHTQNINAL